MQVVLGGVGLSPVETQAGANDTSHLFNLHPILMTLGFGVLMAEALLAYRAPLLLWLTRCVHSRDTSPVPTPWGTCVDGHTCRCCAIGL